MTKKSLLFGAVSLLALTSCGGQITHTETATITETTMVTETVTVTETATVTETIVNTENTIITSGYPSSVKTCKFGEEIAKASWDLLGTVIPSIEGYASIEYAESVDDFGDPLLAVYLCYDSDKAANKAWDDYANASVSKGYDVEVVTQRSVDYDAGTYFLYDVAYADRNIGDHLGIEIQTLVSMYKGKDALGIFAYNYVDCAKNEFPTALFEHYLGVDAYCVPALENESYKYSHQIYMENGLFIAEIVVENCSYEVEEEYFNKVMKICGKGNMLRCNVIDDDDYALCNIYPEFEDEYYYQAACNNNVCVIFDYDLYNYGALIIDVYYSPTGLFN